MLRSSQFIGFIGKMGKIIKNKIEVVPVKQLMGYRKRAEQNETGNEGEGKEDSEEDEVQDT